MILRILDWLDRRSLPGIVLSAWFYFDSLRPSLLPRGALIQGSISALWMLVGYGFGVLIGRLINAHYKIARPIVLRRLAFYIAGAGMLVVTIMTAGWQRQQIELLSLSDRAYNPLAVIILSGLFTALLITIGLGVHKVIFYITGHLDRILPRVLAFAGAVAAVLFLFYAGLSYGVLRLQQNLELGQKTFDPEVKQPDSPLRSGSPASFIAWEGLGKKGREFVSAEQPGLGREPVRVYVGIDNEPDIKARAELVIDELERTGAFERRAIVLFTPSGTGWVNEAAVAAVESILDGDLASAAIQYSSVSSFLQFVINQDLAGEVSSALYNLVRSRLDQIDPAYRPKLYLYGESLGSLGSQAAFTGVNPHDYSTKFDGALWVGTPSAGRLWSELYQRRGSLSNVAYYGAGHVPPQPDAVFVTNPTDPVVWLNRELLISEPGWLKNRPTQISPNMSWRGGLTFIQMVAELLKSSTQPSGVGHAYQDSLMDAWAYLIE